MGLINDRAFLPNGARSAASGVKCLNWTQRRLSINVSDRAEHEGPDRKINTYLKLSCFWLVGIYESGFGWSLKDMARRCSYFLAGAVFCRFHILSVWSSEAVMRTGSTGWNVKARIPSKWLLNVNFGFHVFLMASVLLPICGEDISSDRYIVITTHQRFRISLEVGALSKL